MSGDRVVAPGPVGGVIETRCVGCGECVSVCAYGAVSLYETRGGDKAAVDPGLCQGDGLCSSLCATGAIAMKGDTNEEIFRQIESAFDGRENG